MTLKQRADLTHRYNRNNGRHGWLRLTPAYSVKLVQEILAQHDKKARVLDPFSGTGTTALCAAYIGHYASALDINPFLIWLANVKSDRYSSESIDEARDIISLIKQTIDLNQCDMSPKPPIFNIERWWNSDALDFLRMLKFCLDSFKDKATNQAINLIKISFCRTMIQLSNASFNHQSMSFKDKMPIQVNLLSEKDIFMDNFIENFENVISSAYHNPIEKVNIIYGDSRVISENIQEKYNLVITSPPYPNRMSYIRELRPYMYWLDYLYEAREAGELDWTAIGGTWGIATSRLMEWSPLEDTPYPGFLRDVLKQIESKDNKNGSLLSRYIAKYFEDIWKHLQSLIKIMEEGSEIHYIVGNSTFYDVLVPVEEVYKHMMNLSGFKNPTVKVIRKRNSKKELLEFDIVARK